MYCGGPFAAMLGSLYSPSMALCAGASLSSILYFQLGHRPVPIATSGILPVAIVAVSYSVIYQGSVLIFTKLADQLGLQG